MIIIMMMMNRWKTVVDRELYFRIALSIRLQNLDLSSSNGVFPAGKNFSVKSRSFLNNIRKGFVLVLWDDPCQPYLESATALSDYYYDDDDEIDEKRS